MSDEVQPDWEGTGGAAPAPEPKVEPERLQRRQGHRGRGVRPANYDLKPGDPGYDPILDPNSPTYRYRGIAHRDHRQMIAQRDAANQRRVEVARMMVKGVAPVDMARELGVEVMVIYRDQGIIRRGWKKDRASAADELIELQLRRLEEMHSSIWEQAILEGNLFAVDRLVRINESVRRLFGLDKAIKLDADGDPAEMANRLTERLDLLADRLRAGTPLLQAGDDAEGLAGEDDDADGDPVP